MADTERPSWTSWAWPTAFGVVGLLAVLLPLSPVGPIASGWSFASFAALVVGVVLWAVIRTKRQRLQYERRLEQWARDRAIQDERLRLARELHDLASHGLGVMTVRAATAQLADEDERLLALADIEHAGRGAMAQLRSMLSVLRTADVDAPMRPVDSLADLPGIVDSARQDGIRVEFDTDELGEPPAELQATVCAVVRETLANAARHAGPTNVRVALTADEDGIRIAVRDSGPSPGWRAHQGTGYGLTGLRERVELHGGTLTTGRAGAGYQVVATLPTKDDA